HSCTYAVCDSSEGTITTTGSLLTFTPRFTEPTSKIAQVATLLTTAQMLSVNCFIQPLPARQQTLCPLAGRVPYSRAVDTATKRPRCANICYARFGKTLLRIRRSTSGGAD